MDSSVNLSGHILLVSPDAPPSDLQVALDRESWGYDQVESPGNVIRRLRGDSQIDLVIIAPGSSIWDHAGLCRNIKFDARTAFISVIYVLEPVTDVRRIEVFECGADDCIQLPASSREIVIRLLNGARVKRMSDSLEDSTTVITALANAIEGKDAYTRGHVERVATYAVEIAKRVGVDVEDLAIIKTGALVHDVGKVVVPDHILNKPGRLTDEEMDIMKRHPVVGYDILQALRTFRRVLPIVRWHHERPNGTGYPDGISGEVLTLFPRIMAVADCFDAISTDRPYRKCFPMSKCRAILNDAAAKGELDADLVAVLMDILDNGDLSLAGIATASAADADLQPAAQPT